MNVAKKDKKYYNFLMDKAWIVGIIDSYGAVHSTIFDFGDEMRTQSHGDIYPGHIFHRWRWCWNRSLNSLRNDEFTIEDWDKVERHLGKVYDIIFWENGHHDINYIMGKGDK